VSVLTACTLLLAGALAYVEVRSAARAAAEARLSSLGQQLVGLIVANLEPRREMEERLSRAAALQAALAGRPVDSLALAEALGEFRTGQEENLQVLLISAEGRQLFAVGASPHGADSAHALPLDSVRTYGPFREVGEQVLYWQSLPVVGPQQARLGCVLSSLIRLRISAGSSAETAWR
jgi:hypothetical protein